MYIATFGYSVRKAEYVLRSYLEHENVIITDVRYSTRSVNRPEWSRAALQEKYADRYVQIHELGNKNYYNRDLPIDILDIEKGLYKLTKLLNEGYIPLLLCTCINYHSCHRKKIIDELQKRMPDVYLITLKELKDAEK